METMEAAAVWFNLCIAVVVLALNLRVRAAIMQNQPDLKKRVYRAAYKSFGGGIVCILLGVLYVYLGLPPWSWMSGAGILIISVATPLLIQAKMGGLAGGGSKKSGKKIDTIAKRLICAAVAVFLVSAAALVILRQLAIL